MALPPWMELINGGPVWPSNVSYRRYNLTVIGSNITLQFPWVATNDFIAAGTIVVTSNIGNYDITMPDVRQVAPGYMMWVNNQSASNLVVRNNDGDVIQTIAPDLMYGLQIIDNTTAAGEWERWQFAAGSSEVTASQLIGPGITTNPFNATRLAVEVPTVVLPNAPYTIDAADRAFLLVWEGGTETIDLPASNTLVEGFLFYFTNVSVGGIVTLVAQGGDTINGASSITVNPGSGFEVILGPDGKFYTIGLDFSSINNFTFPDGDEGNPSINFDSDHNSGFYFSYTSADTQSLNISLHGEQYVSFALVDGDSFAHFIGTVMSHQGVYVFGTDAEKTRLEIADNGGNKELHFLVYNVAGNAFTEMILDSNGRLSYITGGGGIPLTIDAKTFIAAVGAINDPALFFTTGPDNFSGLYIGNPNTTPYLGIRGMTNPDAFDILKISNTEIDAPQAEFARQNTSYLAWSRII